MHDNMSCNIFCVSVGAAEGDGACLIKRWIIYGYDVHAVSSLRCFLFPDPSIVTPTDPLTDNEASLR